MKARSLIRAAGAGTVVALDGPNGDMLQDFSILKLGPGQVVESDRPLERVFLLLHGTVQFTRGDTSTDATRMSLYNEGPWTLQVPAGLRVTISARDGAELALFQTENAADFPARVYPPESCRSEMRGAGTAGEAATRIVRTIFDNRDAPRSNFVLGEVVAPPGKWSSYPPHHHPQPEIYHYRFSPKNGFGIAVVGDQAHTVRSGDTILIRQGQVHPQAAAPGYVMWYLWSIRHLDGNRYGTPEYQPEHAWTAQAGAEISTPGTAAEGARK